MALLFLLRGKGVARSLSRDPILPSSRIWRHLSLLQESTSFQREIKVKRTVLRPHLGGRSALMFVRLKSECSILRPAVFGQEYHIPMGQFRRKRGLYVPFGYGTASFRSKSRPGHAGHLESPVYVGLGIILPDSGQ